MVRRNNRKDLLTGNGLPRERLNRFVIKEGKLFFDETGRAPGRGAYLEKGKGQEAIRRKSFARFLHRELTLEEKEMLIAL